MSTIPLIYFEQFTKEKEYQTFCINSSQRVIMINDKELDMEVLKTIAKEEDLKTFFEAINFIKPERTTINGTIETLDIFISNTSSEDSLQELCVKADYIDGNNGYNPIVINDLQIAITKTWNNLFEHCLKISSDKDYEILKAVSKLYLSRRSEYPTLKHFHDFTMNILKASELTPLESAYKEFIRRIFEGQIHKDNDLILFEDITVSRNECYLQIMFYGRLAIKTMKPAYQPYISKFGKFNKPTFREGPLTIASISNESGMTRVNDIIDMLN